MPKELGLPTNGVLRLYNQFPRCYANIHEMTAQLPDIAAMGFNAVWMNPIQLVGQLAFEKQIGSERKQVKGSLYAMSNSRKIDDTFSVTRQNSDDNPANKSALEAYTANAVQNNLVPIFDLVLNHIAIDSALVTTHSNWFLTTSAFGSDVINFDYTYPVVRAQIIDFWKNFISQYVEFGFRGIRVDAVKLIFPEIQDQLYSHLHECCKKKYGDSFEPIIFAEVFLTPGDSLSLIASKHKRLGITHVTNSLHWEPFTEDYRKWCGSECRWERKKDDVDQTLTQLGLLRQMACNAAGVTLGGTIGFSGCHDTMPLYEAVIEDKAKNTVDKQCAYNRPNPKVFKRRCREVVPSLRQDISQLEHYGLLKEKIAAVAFTSDAGWYLLSGDEFGAPDRKSVFDFYKPCEAGNTFRNQWSGQFDLRPFIKGVNDILSRLPKPDLEFWVQHVVLEKKPDLMIVIRHNGRGYSKTAELVVVNLTEQQIELSKEDIEQIARVAALREPKQSPAHAEAITCVMGTINFSNQSQSSSSSTSSSSTSTSTTDFQPKIFCLGNIKLVGLAQYVIVVRTDNFQAPIENLSTPPAAPALTRG
jgi:hypothetical protein